MKVLSFITRQKRLMAGRAYRECLNVSPMWLAKSIARQCFSQHGPTWLINTGRVHGRRYTLP